MTLRSSRLMTSIFLTRDDRVLLLYRVGSRAVPDSWVGIGGHLEPDEITDPTRAALRELSEEIGLAADDITGLTLRYVSVRDTGAELRFTWYFTASLRPDVSAPTACLEGELRWFDVSTEFADLTMPATTRVALSHWQATSADDAVVRAIVMTEDGPRVQPLRSD